MSDDFDNAADETETVKDETMPARRSQANRLFGPPPTQQTPPARQAGQASRPGPATQAGRLTTGTPAVAGARPKSQAEKLFGGEPEKYLNLKDGRAKLNPLR